MAGCLCAGIVSALHRKSESHALIHVTTVTVDEYTPGGISHPYPRAGGNQQTRSGSAAHGSAGERQMRPRLASRQASIRLVVVTKIPSGVPPKRWWARYAWRAKR